VHGTVDRSTLSAAAASIELQPHSPHLGCAPKWSRRCLRSVHPSESLVAARFARAGSAFIHKRCG